MHNVSPRACPLYGGVGRGVVLVLPNAHYELTQHHRYTLLWYYIVYNIKAAQISFVRLPGNQQVGGELVRAIALSTTHVLVHHLANVTTYPLCWGPRPKTICIKTRNRINYRDSVSSTPSRLSATCSTCSRALPSPPSLAQTDIPQYSLWSYTI